MKYKNLSNHWIIQTLIRFETKISMKIFSSFRKYWVLFLSQFKSLNKKLSILDRSHWDVEEVLSLLQTVWSCHIHHHHHYHHHHHHPLLFFIILFGKQSKKKIELSKIRELFSLPPASSLHISSHLYRNFLYSLNPKCWLSMVRWWSVLFSTEDTEDGDQSWHCSCWNFFS